MKGLLVVLGLAVVGLWGGNARAQSLVLEVPQSTHTCIGISLSSGTAIAMAPLNDQWVSVVVDNEDTTNDVRCGQSSATACTGTTLKGKRVQPSQTVGWTIPKSGQWWCVSCSATGPTNIEMCRAK